MLQSATKQSARVIAIFCAQMLCFLSPAMSKDYFLLGEAVSESSNVSTVSAPEVIQSQPQFLPQTAFTSRNGLPTKGYIWLSVEAIFGDHGDSDTLIGDARAPQVFGDRFMAASMEAIDGNHVGIPDLQPGLVGQQIVNDDVVGTKLRIGYRSERNGGLELDGLWMGDSERSWQRGLGGLTAGADPTTVRVTAALPLYNGGDGYAVPYDQFFRFGVTTEVDAIGFHYAPYGRYCGAILVQPTIGWRHVNMNELFGFAGADSGLSYEHNADGTPIESTLDPPQVAVPPYQTLLNVTSDTQLTGPLIGLTYSTSGKRIRFGGNTRVGVLFADSEQTMNGQGFGDGFAPGFNPSITFSDTRSESYSTPIIEQTLHLDIDVLRIIPPLDRIACDGSLLVRLGWSIMAIDRVTRPVDSIAWNGFPLTPNLKSTKNDWYLQTWNIGAILQY